MLTAFEATLIEPTNITVSDTIGLYAMPIASNVQNTGDRIRSMVEKTGFPMYISDLFAQNRKTIFDMAAKDANSPAEASFRDMSYRRRDFFAELIEKTGVSEGAVKTFGMGDSLGVPAIQGMQLFHEGTRPVFDSVLLRDGWNLTGSESKLQGFAHYISYTIRDELHKRRAGVSFDIQKYGYEGDDFAKEDETSLPQKLWNVADMMRSHRNIADAASLCRKAVHRGFAMNFVLFRNGLSGTPNVQRAFISDLHYAFDSELELLAGGVMGNRPGIDANIHDGWHSDLLDPIRGSEDVRNTLKLLRIE